MMKTHVIDGVTYVEVERRAEVGEYVTYVFKGKRDNVIRKVEDIDDDGDVTFYENPYVDSEGSEISGFGEGGYHVLEPLESEEVTVDGTQASPEVIDMLANLARRVNSLEAQLASTQINVERQAEQTESNSEDIRTLDERTQPKETAITNPEEKKEPTLVFVQHGAGSDFTLYQDGKEVRGIRNMHIYASYDGPTTHEVEYVTGATNGGER